MGHPPVTVIFPCYQQVEYVRPALRSVLAQRYAPLQIVISDDASTDGTFEAVQEEMKNYEGPHTVAAQQNAERKGVENYNRLMEMADAEFIVVAHSDDISFPNRVERLVEVWQETGVSLVSSNAERMDKDGQVTGLFADPDYNYDITLSGLVAHGWNYAMLGATLAWERAVFSEFGPLNRTRTAVSTDWMLPFRAMLLRGMKFIAEPLIQYRTHPKSRGNQFLKHEDNELANRESKLANGAAQYVYMLETLGKFMTQRNVPIEKWQTVQQGILKGIVNWTGHWTSVRNQLMAAGYRVRWDAVVGK